MPLRSIFFLLYFAGSSAGSLAAPMVGVVCYIVLYHVYPQTTWWGQPLEFMGIRYAFVCGLCLLIGVTLNLNRLRFGSRFMHPLEWGLMAMLMFMLLSTLTGTPWNYRTDVILDKISKVFLFTFMMSHVVVTRERLWWLMLAFTVLTLYLGHEARIAPPGAFHGNRLDGIGGPDFQESSGLAIHLFAMMPFIAITFRQPSWKLKLLSFFAACYAMNAALLCQTRSAFLGAVAAGAAALLYVPRNHLRFVVTILVLGSLGGFTLSDSYFRERMLTIFSSAEERDRSASSRLEIWEAAGRMVRDNPWGVGIGHFEQEIGRYAADETLDSRDAHNTYVLCVGEIGIAGLAMYLLILVMAWLTLSSAARKARSRLAEPDFLLLLVFANRLALIVFVVSGMFVSRFYTEGIWWLLLLPVCISRAVENQIREEAAQCVEVHVQGPVEIVHSHAVPAGGRLAWGAA